MAFFYYQRNTFGKYAPAKARDRPETKGSDGTQNKPFRGVVELTPEQEQLTLAELMKVFPDAN